MTKIAPPAHISVWTARPRVVVPAITVLGVLWLGWLGQTGALRREIQVRRTQILGLLGVDRASAEWKSTGRHPELSVLASGAGLATRVGSLTTIAESTVVLVASPDTAHVRRLVEYHERLVSVYRLPVRIAVYSKDDRQARSLAGAVGISSQSPFYVAVKSPDSLAFRAWRLLSLDEHRQLLGELYEVRDKLRPLVPESPEYWTRRIRDARFAFASDTVSGDALLANASVLVVLEAECSPCRIGEHAHRLRVAGLDTAAGVLLVSSARHAAALGKATRRPIAVSLERLGIAPELGIVSRDVAAADPLVLKIVGGSVLRVERLSSRRTVQ